MRYTTEQQKIIDSWDKAMVIIAGAGCGKTTTLVHKCKALLEKNSQSKFCAVSFTERSASDLKEKLSEQIDLYAEGSSHWVMTIHGLCAAIIRDFAYEAGLEGGETVIAELEATQYWKHSLESLWFDELSCEQEQALSVLLKTHSPESLSALIARLKSLRSFGILEKIKTSELEEEKALYVISRFVFDQYDQFKRNAAMLDFDDLEVFANRALSQKSVQQYYQNRFDLVLVDEFQDTNPVQAEIISKFTKPNQSNLCVVGDPKQSIYRFRDADLSVFLETVKKLPLQFSLTWNFRSHPDIIEAVNRSGEKVFLNSDLDYEPLVAKKEQKKEIDHPVLELALEKPEDLVAWVQEQVDQGVGLHEMTLLLRKIKGNEKWIQAFIKMGVPLSLESGGLYWDNPRVRECVSFLKWWYDPSNQLSALTFLRAPWVGLIDQTIDDWFCEKKDMMTEFLKLNHPISNELKKIQAQMKRPSEVLLKLLATPEIEEEIGMSLLMLWHQLEELSASGKDSYQIGLYLSEMLETTPRAKEIPPPANLGSLSVMTLHSSKGLEFDRVILVDFDGRKRAANAPLLFWDRHQGYYLAKRDEHSQRIQSDPKEKSWKELEKEKELNESKRLFYVALTRAKEQVVMAMLPEKKTKAATDPFLTDDWRSWVQLSEIEKKTLHPQAGEFIFSKTKEKPNPVILQSFQEQVQYKRARHSVTEWLTLEKCPRAYEWKYIRPRFIEFEEQSEFQQSVQQLGTQVHAALENPTIEKIKALEGSQKNVQFQSAPLLDWIETSVLMQKKESRQVWTELSFEVAVTEDDVLVGSIDRLIKQENLYTVVDFKVTQKKTDPEILKARYLTQMLLYRKAVCELEKVSFDAVQCKLVHIHPGGVQEIEMGGEDQDWRTWVDASHQVLSQSNAKPHLGSHCQSCEFRFECQEASKSFGFLRSEQ